MVCISIQPTMHALKHLIAFAKENILKRLAYKQLRVSYLTLHIEWQNFLSIKIETFSIIIKIKKVSFETSKRSHIRKRIDQIRFILYTELFSYFFLYSCMVYIRFRLEQCQRQRFSILQWFVNGFSWWLGSLCWIGLGWIFTWNSLLGIHYQ